MSLKIILEDNESSAISQLLKRCFKEDTLIFTNGNKNICKMIKTLSPDISGIIYLDVVPDNKQTITIYNQISKLLEDEAYRNRFILLPIPCIEYYVIRAFCNIEPSISQRYTTNYRSLNSMNGRLLGTRSFESYCKSIVRNYNSCLSNKFLISECDTVCSCADSISYGDKIIEFLRSLPVFINSVLTEELVHHVDLYSIRDELIDMFNKAYKAYVAFGYIKGD